MAEPTDIQKKFILHWGEMGSKWGINRTVAQVHALLYVSAKPLNAEEITKTLSVARSNVSTSLQELQRWGIVKTIHVMGDRKEYFESLKDPWKIFQLVLEQRRKQETDPTLAMLRDLTIHAGKDESAKPIQDMLDFFETMTDCHETVKRLPPEPMKRLMKMTGKAVKLLGLG